MTTERPTPYAPGTNPGFGAKPHRGSSEAESSAQNLERQAERWERLAPAFPKRALTVRGTIPSLQMKDSSREDLLEYAESAREVAQEIRETGSLKNAKKKRKGATG